MHAIGSGANRSCGKIVIYGGDIEAHGGVNGAGIGGGSKGNGGQIVIERGTVRAYGAASDAWFVSAGAAGIGGGYGGSGSDVEIRGGKVYAKGAESAAGIGGGGDAGASSSSNSGYGGSVYIGGGVVEAYGGPYGAGIGGGFGGSYGTIVIEGGTVRAEAGALSQSCGTELSREQKTTPATGHSWTQSDYTWSQDDSEVTAERHCTVCDKEEKETAKASSQVIKEPTETEPGEATVTAEFENPAFEVQTKKKAIPPTRDDPEPEAASYEFVSGDGNTWQQGSLETCNFTVKRTASDEITFAHFMGIRIDDKEVDSGNYTALPGSVIMQLQPAYLETLSLGEHSITALFDDAPDATARFSIAAESSSDNNSSNSSEKAIPVTGDTIPVVFLTMLAVVAGALLLLSVKKRREE